MQIPEFVHTLRVEEVLEMLQSGPDGLSKNEVIKRRHEFGKNLLKEEEVSRLSILIEQFKSPLIVILLFASLISLFVGHIADALLIFFIVCLNASLGFWQELKALTSIELLAKMSETTITVLRDSKEVTLASSLLVPGDLVYLHEGDIVPADLLLIECEGLQIDESVLTGESLPVSKEAKITLPQKTLPYELDNMALSGTIVVSGSATAVAVYTAHNTYLASIASRAKEKSPQSPLN
ncbi:HAD-IC family P-type ATPase, partial [bacterium]|nr:HAD-IC family P-type ATPase [bacterium]